MKKYVTLGSAATVTALCFIVLMFACQKESSLIPATAARSDEKYLEFKDKDEFDKTVKDLAKKSRQELDAWDKANNFVSLRGLYEQIIDEENATAEKEDALIKANPNLKSTMKHQYSSLLDDCKQMISYNNAGIDMNLFEPQYAKVLNKDGVVKIGTSLYQFGADNYKVVVDADYANVKNLLTVSKDNQTDNMKYFPVRVSNQLLKNGRPNNSGSCQSDNNSFRLEATAYSYYFYQPNIYSGDFYNKVVLGIKMKFTRDHWYGRTNYSSSGYYAYGTWGYSIYLIPRLTPSSGGPFDYNTGQSYVGQSTEPYFQFYEGTWNGEIYPYGSVTLTGTHNFVFFTGGCSCTVQL